MHCFINDPTLKAEGPSDANLKHRALADFQLVNNKLYKNPDSKFLEPRLVVPESEAFNTIANEHLQLLYAGRDKVWAIIQQKYYSIT